MELLTKDLRIGNLVYRKTNGEITVVEEVLKNRITCINNILINTKLTSSQINNFEPILLNSDWVVNKLGFITEMDNCSFVTKDGIGKNNWKMRIWNIGDCWCWNSDSYFKTEFKYVHQLQNLYHSIANEELIINLK